jgi:hypothetical protein
MPLPSPASTPLSLTLPAGSYRVVVTGPPPESQPQQVDVRIETGAPSVVPLLRFRSVTPEEYFEQYLTSPAGSSDVPGTPVEPQPAASGLAGGATQ